MRCHSIVRLQVGLAAPSDEATGYAPADLQSAYNAPSSTAGTGQTVAIVDAFDDPNAEADMNLYRAHFGLSLCTSASGCFKKVNQNGGATPPRRDPTGGWELEESLDLQMVSAMCPNCKILLVEASLPTTRDLGIAVNTAVSLGANVVSNSYGGSETSTERSSDRKYYNHPGVIITASSGDSGFGAQYPAASPFVVAVGGTSLTRSHSGKDWGEVAWAGAGSGCSAFEPKPKWQSDPSCANRTIADTAAVADPSTGVAVYDSYPYQGTVLGWLVVGGTSAASPIVASMYALAGNTASLRYGESLYTNAGDLFDVNVGYNNSTVPGCSFPSYLCTGVNGYDGPTGNGTPNGTAAF
jgi:subtilase family serine protease